MAVDLNSFICELPLFANKQSTCANLSRTPRLSFAGVSCENLSLNHAKSVDQKKLFSRTQGKKTIAGSHVGTLAAFVMDNLYMDL